jgi:CRP-like cAMP-binding protein
MKKYINILKSVDLFRGIDEADILSILPCLGAQVRFFKKGETVLHSGDSARRFGIVLSGQVQIVQEDYYGNRRIIAKIGAGGLFGESFAFAQVNALPVTVAASEDCEILFTDSAKLTSPCERTCSFHSGIIRNMLGIVSMKNISLTRKIEITSKRTTREKLLAYLSYEAKRSGKNTFMIPFNRQELADYLSVDRSAMSAELSRLRKDGVLNYRKNRFELM